MAMTETNCLSITGLTADDAALVVAFGGDVRVSKAVGDWTYTRWVGVDFLGCDFLGVDLRGSRFEQCRLDFCELSGADMRGVEFVNTSAWYSNIEDAITDVSLWQWMAAMAEVSMSWA